MYHSGIAATAMRNFLAAMEVPSMSNSTLKKREREIAESIHTVAQNSCQQALDEEKRLSQAK